MNVDYKFCDHIILKALTWITPNVLKHAPDLNYFIQPTAPCISSTNLV